MLQQQQKIIDIGDENKNKTYVKVPSNRLQKDKLANWRDTNRKEQFYLQFDKLYRDGRLCACFFFNEMI